jgi:gamma-glutamyltranspeptidase/glutathione hydrolase
VLQTLGILENFNVRSLKPGTADSVHLISRPTGWPMPTRSVHRRQRLRRRATAGLINKDYLKARASIIKMDKSMGAPTPGTLPGAVARVDTSLSLPSTSHMSIVDSFGNVVSMTTTIENASAACMCAASC